MDNKNFIIGEFRPVYSGGDDIAGGIWLGNEFFKSIGEKYFSV